MSETADVVSPQEEATVTKKAQEFLQGVLVRMGLKAIVVVVEETDRIILNIECEDVDRVIGRRGQVVDALQHLVGKVASRDSARGNSRMMVVDARGN